ncbi:hypothetical protein OAA91_01935 [Fibrobacterales bacterium]|nr:hypothetical protein [Fibrobacterales bacterium]
MQRKKILLLVLALSLMVGCLKKINSKDELLMLAYESEFGDSYGITKSKIENDSITLFYISHFWQNEMFLKFSVDTFSEKEKEYLSIFSEKKEGDILFNLSRRSDSIRLEMEVKKPKSKEYLNKFSKCLFNEESNILFHRNDDGIRVSIKGNLNQLIEESAVFEYDNYFNFKEKYTFCRNRKNQPCAIRFLGRYNKCSVSKRS